MTYRTDRDYDPDYDYDRWGYGRGYYDRDYDYNRQGYGRGYYGRESDYDRWTSARSVYGRGYYDYDYDRRRYGPGYYGGSYGRGPYGEPYYGTRSWMEPESWRGPYIGRGPRGYRRSDERIRDDMVERLTWHGDIDASDIEVDVSNGVVTLKGQVNSRWEKRQAADVADDILGVTDVHNQIQIRQEQGRERAVGM